MTLDAAACRKAHQARDARFDGMFFIGVTSTGIYCRPVCTARLPRPENCRYFPSAAAAEAAGFRPCRLCRPERAPGCSAVDAGQRLALAAARLIDEGALEDAGLPELCRRLGVGPRHVRRVFRQRFGVAPAAYAQTRRLLLARALLTETAMPVTDVAFASGFGSLRRFNALCRSRWGLSPTDLRRAGGEQTPENGLTLTLAYRPPYDWTGMLAFLASRAVAGVETADASAYGRTVRLVRQGNAHTGWLHVARDEKRHALRVRISASLLPTLPAALARVSRLFDLACDPMAVAAALGPLAAGHEGLRLPGAMDGFEVAVRAILGQQVTVAAARTLAGRFAAAFGTPCPTPFPGLRFLFPTPEATAALAPSDIAALGIIAGRARAVIALATAMRDKTLSLDPGADPALAVERLRGLPGIGDWTAQYVAMRALGWPDAFPHTDHGVKKALGETQPARVLALAQRWRPWRAYAVMHLWRTLGETADAARKTV